MNQKIHLSVFCIALCSFSLNYATQQRSNPSSLNLHPDAYNDYSSMQFNMLNELLLDNKISKDIVPLMLPIILEEKSSIKHNSDTQERTAVVYLKIIFSGLGIKTLVNYINTFIIKTSSQKNSNPRLIQKKDYKLIKQYLNDKSFIEYDNQENRGLCKEIVKLRELCKEDAITYSAKKRIEIQNIVLVKKYCSLTHRVDSFDIISDS